MKGDEAGECLKGVSIGGLGRIEENRVRRDER